MQQTAIKDNNLIYRIWIFIIQYVQFILVNEYPQFIWSAMNVERNNEIHVHFYHRLWKKLTGLTSFSNN